MYDFHTHTILSDGELLPSELARRCKVKGYKCIGITDHVDYSNVDNVVNAVKKAAKQINQSDMGIKVIPGVELTHISLNGIKQLVDYVRTLGINLIIGHGESLSEPVIKGTNRLFVEAGVDILAHPGLIDRKTVELAKERGVLLEITARKSHSMTNGHVAKLSSEISAGLVIDTDTHSPEDIVSLELLEQVALGSGLTKQQVNDIFDFESDFSEKLIKKSV